MGHGTLLVVIGTQIGNTQTLIYGQNIIANGNTHIMIPKVQTRNFSRGVFKTGTSVGGDKMSFYLGCTLGSVRSTPIL